jgi:hypothetical protein
MCLTYIIGFEVWVVTVNSYISWDITPCGPVKVSPEGRKYLLGYNSIRSSESQYIRQQISFGL